MTDEDHVHEDESGNHVGAILLKKLPLFALGYLIGTGLMLHGFNWVPAKVAMALCEAGMRTCP